MHPLVNDYSKAAKLMHQMRIDLSQIQKDRGLPPISLKLAMWLLAMESKEAQTPSGLGKVLGLYRSGAAECMQRLLEKGLITVKRDPADHRRLQLSLTTNSLPYRNVLKCIWESRANP